MRYRIPFSLICLVLVSVPIFAFFILPHRPLTDEDYVDAIVGEASDQTEDTMICIAHALRNRDNLHGVFGYHAKHNKTETKDTWRKAALAWDISAHEKDNISGAKNWGTEDDLEENDYDVKIKAQCGDFFFY